VTIKATAPWYREPWPWLLMSGPAAVVVAGVLTTVIAVRSFDGVVADDYYKQGLSINRTLERSLQARVLGAGAEAAFAPDVVDVRFNSNAPSPERLRLLLIHPTRRGMDRSATLERSARGVYEGRIDSTGATSWIVALEDERSSWRIDGRWMRSQPLVRLAPAN
jgi:uncharacterized protein